MPRKAVQVVEIGAKHKNIDISIVSNIACVLKCDRNMIDTILRDLLSNINKFTNIDGRTGLGLIPCKESIEKHGGKNLG